MASANPENGLIERGASPRSVILIRPELQRLAIFAITADYWMPRFSRA
jgi:hypothetical protein